MVRNLYQSLLTYKEKPNRTPLEEFTSGALADLLSRMSPLRLTDFLNLFAFSDGERADVTCPADWSDLDWNAEFSVHDDDGWGRADLIALDDTEPSVLIENKIGAVVTERQIDLYNTALKRSRASVRMLLFLTHHTTPPALFTADSERGAVRYGAAYWRDVYTYFTTLQPKNGEQVLAALGGEFAAFLKSRELHSDMMTHSDIASLRLYFNSRAAIEQTLDILSASVSERVLEVTTNRAQTRKWEDVGRKGHWWNCTIDGLEKSFSLSSGILYPELTDWDLPNEEDAPVAFLIFEGAEVDANRLDAVSWYNPGFDGERLVIKNLSKLAAKGDQAAGRLREWVDDELEKFVDALTTK